MKRYLDICTWSKCGGSCPSDKPHVLTTDSGGPRGARERCSYSSDDYGIYYETRKLCCPKKDSFKNCKWKKGGICSEQCNNGQITLDLDPEADGYGARCHNGMSYFFFYNFLSG